MYENIRNYWNELGGNARKGIVIGSVIILAFTIWLAYVLLHVKYGVLFSELDPKDTANIVSELERAKIPYKLDADGMSILVEEDKIHTARLKMMSKGMILNGVVGFEIFDKSDFGMTEYAQKINYQRALQGELARTIGSIREVKLARVHLVMPEGSLFKNDRSGTKASVSLILHDGSRLSQEQVTGIQGLVAAAIPGLVPGAVTVLDQSGRTISTDTQNNMTPQVMTQIELKKKVEDYFVHKIVDVLDRRLGQGKAIVSVDVTLNLDQIKTTEESILPVQSDIAGDVGAVLRKKSTQHSQPTSSTRTDSQGDTRSIVENRTVNNTNETEYIYGKKIEQIVFTPGGIRRISIGVMITSKLSEEEISKIRDVVDMTAGINSKRGDALVVNSVFRNMDDTTESENNALRPLGNDAATGKMLDKIKSDKDPGLLVTSMKFITTWAGYTIAVFLIILASLFLVREKKRVLSTQSHAEEQSRSLTGEQRDVLLRDLMTWLDAENIEARNTGGKS